MKKKIIFILITVLVFTSFLLIANKFSNNKISSNSITLTQEEKDIYKFIRIKYLVMEKTNEEYDINTAFPDHFDDYLAFDSEYMLLDRDEDYYVVNLKNQANKKILDSISSYSFAINNNYAEVLDDCIFDKDTLEIKIPAKYYNAEYELERRNSSVQIELLSRLTEDEIENLNINFNNKRIFNNKKNIVRNGKNQTFSVTGIPKQNKEDIKVYLNNSDLSIDSSYYNYNSKTGKIDFTFSPLLVNDIKVTYISNLPNILGSIFINSVDAITYDDTYYNATDRFPTFEISTPTCASNSSCSTSGSINLRVGTIGDYQNYNNDITAYRELVVANSTFVSHTTVYLSQFPAYSQCSTSNLSACPAATDVWNILTDQAFTEIAGTENNVLADIIKIPSGAFDNLYSGNNINDIYIATNCIHIVTPSVTRATSQYNYNGTNGGTNTFPFKWKVTDESAADANGYKTLTIVMMLDPTQYYWSGTGYDDVAQTLVSGIKLKYKAVTGELKVQKKIDELDSNGNFVSSNASSSDGSFVFVLYSGTSCSGQPLGNETTVDGVATFTNLTPGQVYSVKEVHMSNSSLTQVSQCAVGAISSTPDINNKYTGTINYKNRRTYYCYKVTKKDAEKDSNNNDVLLSGFTFTLSGRTNSSESYTGTTNSNGEYIFSKLSGQPMKLTETSAPSNYTIDGTVTNIDSSDLTEMNYSSTNGYSCPDSVNNTDYTNYKKYYCAKVKKIDSNNNALTGAKFRTTIGGNNVDVVDNTDGNNDGLYTFFLGTNSSNITVTEIEAPNGYSIDSTQFTVSAVQIKKNLTEAQARTECYKANGEDSNGDTIEFTTFANSRVLLNWYKTTENTNKAGVGAKFTVKNGNTTIYHTASKATVTDSNNIQKSCYQYSSTSTGNDSNVFVADANGEVCIVGLDITKQYTITETEPPVGHRFGSVTSITLTPSTNFSAKNDNNRIRNDYTEFEFTKNIVSSITSNIGGGSSVLDYYRSQVQNIEFNIYDSSNNIVSFIRKSNGEYEYANNSLDGTSGTSTTQLLLNDDLKIIVKHLPVGNYKIKENPNDSCSTNLGMDCYGYGFYLPSEVSFEIKNTYNYKTTASMTNTVTEMEFSKKDVYSYENEDDVVKFENNEEVKAFDNIGFKVKTSTGKYLKLKSFGNTGTCNNSSSNSNYYFDVDDSGDGSYASGTVINTCGGKIKIYGLCRNVTYTIEEVSVPIGSVFILPSTHPTVNITIPETGNATTNSNNKVTISDEPTRVVFQKKDVRDTSENISDQTARFEVYRCPKGTTSCTVATSAEQMHFIGKPTIDGEAVFEAISTSDYNSGITGVTSLWLNADGKIVIRYLPSGYYYLLVETVAPKGFYNVTEPLNKIFTVNSESIYNLYNVNDYPTEIKFTKSDIYDYYSGTDTSEMDSNSKEFDKIKFRLYDSTGTLVKLTKVQDGEYRYYDETGLADENDVKDLYTKNGSFTITHLDRNTTYYIEEYDINNSKVFILPNNIDNSSLPGSLKTNKHPIVKYVVGETTSTATPLAISAMMENKPTRVVFKKIDLNTGNIVVDSDKKATFNVYQCSVGATCTESNGTLIYFEDATIISGDIEDIIDGVARKAYKYSKQNASNGKVSNLKLDNGYLVLRYLPVNYNYLLVETTAPDGYYNPPTTERYTEFSVLSTTLDSGENYALPNDVNNTPIELTLTKDDFYEYIDKDDVVKFENEAEVKAFDNIEFQVKDSTNNVISFCKEADETVSGKSISVYSYLNNNCANRVTRIKTKNGSLKLRYLYRATTYTIEEVSVPSHSVFVLPDTKASVTYSISAEGTISTNNSNKKTISNVPTRVLIYKKDDRTNTNITENSNPIEKATFEVYRCSNLNVDCTKSTSNGIVTFMKRETLTATSTGNDNGISDPDLNREVYKFVSTSDLASMSATQKRNLTTTTLELDSNGQIILKYLPTDYKYVIVETNAPDGYYNYVSTSSNVEVSMEVSDEGLDGTVYNFIDAHTEIIFNKTDIYNSSYIEPSIFDTINFVIRNSVGDIIQVTKVADGEYRYIQTNGRVNNNDVTYLNTKNGSLKVTHLLRNSTYYIEEVSGDTTGKFILPENIDNSSKIESTVTNTEFKNCNHPVVKYSIPNEIPSSTISHSMTNKPTRVVIKKKDASSQDGIINDQNAEFEVYRCPLSSTCTTNNGTKVKFVDKAIIPNNEEDGNQKSYIALDDNQTGITTLKLNEDGRIIIRYLSSNYTYLLVEKTAPTGYYDLEENIGNIPFIVDKNSLNSNENIMNNYRVELKFNKEDIYDFYGNHTDLNDSNVFDQINFRLYDKDGVLLRLTKVSDGEYRLYDNSGNMPGTITDLNTKNGSMLITYVGRNTKYYLEEYSVNNNLPFILPNNIDNSSLPGGLSSNKHPIVTYTVDNSISSSSIPDLIQVIENKPTRVAFRKIDKTTGAVVTDNTESATFNVYKCSIESTSCTEENGELVRFTTRSLFNAYEDEIDGVTVQSYKYNKSILAVGRVKDLKLDKGYLVLRYLPTGYKYVLVEKDAPSGYYDPATHSKYTEFIVNDTTLENGEDYELETDVENEHTVITFNKSDIYNYYSSSDIATLNSNDKIFDSMTFVLRDSLGNIVKLTKEQDGVYRFIQDDGSFVNNNISEIHTKNGSLTISYLLKNRTYYIEETKSDTDGIFILPNNIDNSSIIDDSVTNEEFKDTHHPVVKYTLTNETPTEEQRLSLTQLIENKPTRVVFQKKDATTGELLGDQSITFNLYQCDKNVDNCNKNNGNLLKFDERAYNEELTSDITIIDNPIYVYNYSKLNNGSVTDLHVDRGLLVLGYLPSNYKYALYETESADGYYTPTDENGITEFIVKSTTMDTGEDYEELTSFVTNTPTEIYFKKTDVYNYYDKDDLSSLNSNVKIFDSMRFVLRDKDGNVLKLKCTHNGEVTNTSGSCTTGEYRYLPFEESKNYVEELQTINGVFKVTHLVNGETYYIEEVKSDDEGNFILPNYLSYDYDLPFEHSGHPVVKYVLPTNVPESNLSVTKEIENTPSRVVFEKRDSVYGYLITDETTTFNVYRCDKSVETCNSENGEIVNFEERKTIPNDIEDSGREVYIYNKLNESENAVTDLHPYEGVLVLRYLPTEYKYVLIETVSPKQYVLPSLENASIEFTINSETVLIDSVDVPNKPTSLLIRKYSDDGELLEGAEFKIYEGTTCDKNLSAMNQPKELLSLRTIRDGIYENSGIKDTEVVKTCIDKDDYKCNDMTSSLTLDTYVDTWTNFENSLNQLNEKIEIQAGEALIQYLEYGHCYIIEEVKAPKGYSLPENDEDRFLMVTINAENDVVDTFKELINKPTPYTFYKFNDYNELIDGGEYKLQKLNKDLVYEDVKVSEYVKEDLDRKYYKVDDSSDNVIINTLNGTATIYFLTEGQYRIVEVKAPEGMELPTKQYNVSTFYVSSSGKITGTSIIANKPKTEKIEVKPKSQAKLIVNISTGKDLVKYGLIFGVIIITIVVMIFVVNKRKKK